jgi:hypothetical protein
MELPSSEEALGSLKVAELKEILKSHGQSTAGMFSIATAPEERRVCCTSRQFAVGCSRCEVVDAGLKADLAERLRVYMAEHGKEEAGTNTDGHSNGGDVDMTQSAPAESAAQSVERPKEVEKPTEVAKPTPTPAKAPAPIVEPIPAATKAAAQTPAKAPTSRCVIAG